MLKEFFIIIVLACVSHAAVLTCRFNNRQCTIVSLTASLTQNEIISVPKAPFTPYTDSTLIGFGIAPDIQVKEFPRSIFSIFTNISSFTIENVSTNELGTDAFYNCNNLHGIDMRASKIGRIGAGFAKCCTNLMTLQFTSMTSIGPINVNAFTGLSKLTDLTMSRSKLTCLPGALFKPLKSLTILVLIDNSFTALHSQLFAGLPLLRKVILSSCCEPATSTIDYIPNFNLNGTATNHMYTLEIDLTGHPIKAVSPLLLPSLQRRKIAMDNEVTGYGFIGYGNVIIRFTPTTQNMICLSYNRAEYAQTGYYDLIQHDNIFKTSSTCYSAFNASMGTDVLVKC